MRVIYKKFILCGLILAGFNLVACGHKNPLMNEKNIRTMKANFFFDAADFPIEKCTDYYAGFNQANLKKTCDQWSEAYYQKLIQRDQIPTTTTLKDFRDSVFWKQVKAAKFW